MNELRDLPLDLVDPNPDQDRKYFAPEPLEELARSIRENGLLQPITVRPRAGGRFEIIAGERRWRACRLAGLTTVRAIVRDMTDEERDDACSIENLNRVDLTALEEGRTYQRRLDRGQTVEEIARRLGVLQDRVRRRVALLAVLPEYQDAFTKGLLEQNHVNHLSQLEPDFQRLLFAAIRDGRCKTRPALRGMTDKLLGLQAGGRAAPALVALDGEQTSMFGDTGPTDAERERLTAFEAKLERLVATLAEGFDENEVVVVHKVRRGNASTVAEKLELVERHVRKLRIALEKEAAAAGVAA